MSYNCKHNPDWDALCFHLPENFKKYRKLQKKLNYYTRKHVHHMNSERIFNKIHHISEKMAFLLPSLSLQCPPNLYLVNSKNF